MGAKGSKSSKKKCNCALYSRHCCLNQCFAKIKNVQNLVKIPGVHDSWTYDEEHVTQFRNATTKFNLYIPNAIFTAIFSYLTRKPEGYYLHCHAALNQYIEKESICDVWYKDRFRGSPYSEQIQVRFMGHRGAGTIVHIIVIHI